MTFPNYLNGQTLSVALWLIAEEFNFDLTRRGQLLATFTGIMRSAQLGIGALLDRLASVRWFFGVMVLGPRQPWAWPGRSDEHLLVGVRFLACSTWSTSRSVS